VISITEERVRLNPRKPDEINIQDNALIVDNTVYQISNISYAKVRKWKKVEHKPTPVFALIAWLFVGSLLTAIAKEMATLIAGFLIFFAVTCVYASDKLQRLEYIYLLVLHFDSGFEEYLQSRNPKFLKDVVEVLQKKIENPSSTSRYVANFNETRVEMISTNYNDNSQNYNFGDIYGNNNINMGSISGGGQTISNGVNPVDSKAELRQDLENLKALLQKLEGINPHASATDRQQFLESAIPKTTRERLIAAFKAGGESAIKEFLKNPYAKVVVATIKGWMGN
jgi:hypothetical protein